jgi:anti-sigma-K factor RskA
MATTPPDDPDPDDDLIAYLDGELDDDAAEAVESQLANDPAARARADEHKKAFDLLDYLPKSEPSPTFTNRTITRLMPTAAVSGSQPTPTVPPFRRKVGPEVLAWAVLAVLAVSVAFVGSQVWRHAVPPTGELLLSDLPVIESLPLYAGVDDLAFLRELDKFDPFGSESTDTEPPPRHTLSPADREQLIEQFRAFTPARQQQLRTLHQKLNDPTLNDRLSLLRTLETYAVWLARLPDADRKRILDASPDDRVNVVLQVNEKRWRESLPQRQQEALRHVESAEERLELLQAFRAEEADRRQEWEIANRQWQAAGGKERGKDYKPWPFDQPDAAKQVDEYIRTAFGVDPKGVVLRPKKGDKVDALPQSCRLTPQEAAELFECREAVSHGERWFIYGVLLLRLSEKYPTLPRPPAGGKLVVTPKELQGTGYVMPKDDVLKRRAVVGKWPDFAEEVARANPPKEPRLPPLGPSRPDEFTEGVKKFATDTLPPRLNQQEKDRLKGLEGRWPEYPKEMMRLARDKNLSVPEVTLPGEPESWRKYYHLAPAKK